MKIKATQFGYEVSINDNVVAVCKSKAQAENYISWRKKYATQIDSMYGNCSGDETNTIFNAFLLSSNCSDEELVVAASAVFGEAVTQENANILLVAKVKGKLSIVEAAKVALKTLYPKATITDKDVGEAWQSGKKFDRCTIDNTTYIFMV